MRINVATIAHDKGSSLPIDVEEELSLLPSQPDAPEEGRMDAPPEDGTAQLVGPVHFHGEITNAGSIFHLKGKADAQFAAQCARCLEPASFHLTVPVQAEFRRITPETPAAKPVGRRAGQERPAQAEDDWDDPDISPFHGDVVDFAERIREELNLSIPYRVLCREDCAGICPRCGANLNLGPCGCPTDEDDLRLATLAEWKRAEEERGGAES